VKYEGKKNAGYKIGDRLNRKIQGRSINIGAVFKGHMLREE
jgi:hypothetical protein